MVCAEVLGRKPDSIIHWPAKNAGNGFTINAEKGGRISEITLRERHLYL